LTEIIVMTFFTAPLEAAREYAQDEEAGQLSASLIRQSTSMDSEADLLQETQSTTSIADLSVLSMHAVSALESCLLPDDNRQLQLPYHVALTVKLWFVATGLAIASPNLGDILSLVGCASGTLIAFVFPALLAFRLEGYSHLAAVLLFVGCVVGVVGTFYSASKLYADIA
jgi:Transmembrane amino acid transporter protein